MLRVILSILLCFCILQGIELESRITNNKDSSIITQTQYIKGTNTRQGVQTKTSNGVVIFEANYHNGAYHGTVKSFYPNGILQEERHYIKGKMEGIYKVFYENGALAKEQNYTNGKENGEGKKYFENGSLQESYTYHNGIREGVRKEYAKDGILRYETTYKGGKKQTMITYNDKGEIIEQKNCRWKQCF